MPRRQPEPNRHLLITEFLDYGRDELVYSVHTLKSYRSALNAFAVHVSAAHPGVDIPFVTPPVLIAYDQLHARKLAPRTRARNVAALRAFYLWLTDEAKLLKRNPSLKLRPPVLDASRRSCPVGEIRARLLAATERLKGEQRCILARAMLGTMFLAGLRPDDVCQLQLGDVILQDIESYLIVQKGKRNKRREVPLADDLVTWLRAWLEIRNQPHLYAGYPKRTSPRAEQSNAFFVHGPGKRPVTQFFLRSMLRDVKTAAGIHDPNLTPHSLRHSCATTLYEQDVDLPVIQEILGHESVNTTRRYVHPTDKRKFAAVQKLNKQPEPQAPEKKKVKPIRLLRRHTP